MADLTGEIIDGRYQLNRIIDSGGMATIYAALDLRLDRSVAVKIMHPHLAQDENYVARFIREAKAAAALSHPNIVAIQDQGWNQGGIPAVFIVMELVEGSTLRQYLNEQGSLPLTTLLPIIKPVLSALSAAHKIGITHRDVKPENILISKDGRVKIADFGLARGAVIGQTNTAESSVVLGSVSYLAPEQVERGVADARSDVYSAAIVIFESLTGEKPFTGDDPVQVALKHVKERVPRLSQLIVGIPPSLDDLIYLSTSSNPDDRPKDGEDFLLRLKSVEEEFNPAKKQMSLELDLPAVGVEREDQSKKQIKIIEESDHLSSKNAGKSKKKISSRVKKNRSIAAILLISLITASWYIFIGPGTKITVPSVAGLTISGATNKISPLGVNVEIKVREFSEDIDEGRVIRSDPSGGDKVAVGGTVFLFVSQGKERYTVPTIAGLTPEAATTLIENSNLRVGTVTERFTPDVAKGLILTQEPTASARVKRDSLVNFVISKGLEEILVKSYLGQSGEQALNELSTAGFDVDTQYQFSENIPLGAVINQFPTPNQTLAKGGKILLTISEGSEFIFIPNVLSLPTDQARDLLEDLSLKVLVKEIGSKREKVVVSLSPKVGDRVKRGSTITITVS